MKNDVRKTASVYADARAMAEHAGVSAGLVALWFGGDQRGAGTLRHARDVRRACATACLLAERGFPSHMDSFTMAGLTGV